LAKLITPLVLGFLLGVSAPAEARTHGVPCRDSAGNVVLQTKPRNCVLGGRYGYQQAPIHKIRWRSWGGGSSYGRGTLFGNMGFRARVRFKLYRLDRYEEDFYVYRRVSGTSFLPSGEQLHWTMRLPLR
jgi:hypothetical protein